ncbi:hypothetical protein ACLB1S_27920 [Escherichia coli]
MQHRASRNGAECRTGCNAFAPSLVVEDADVGAKEDPDASPTPGGELIVA